MKKEKIVLWGTGKIAEVISFYLSQDSEYEICAYCVDKEYLTESTFLGLPVIAFEEIENVYPPNKYKMSIPIGYAAMNKVREERYFEAKRKGYSFITYISSKTNYYGTPVGENCIILEGCTIQPFTKIGNNVMMWGGTYLAHHSEIEDHCFVSLHVAIAGGSIIGKNSFLGVNSTIRDNIIVGESNLIGAGTVILKSTLANEVFEAKNSTNRMEIRSVDLKNI